MGIIVLVSSDRNVCHLIRAHHEDDLQVDNTFWCQRGVNRRI